MFRMLPLGGALQPCTREALLHGKLSDMERRSSEVTLPRVVFGLSLLASVLATVLVVLAFASSDGIPVLQALSLVALLGAASTTALAGMRLFQPRNRIGLERASRWVTLILCALAGGTLLTTSLAFATDLARAEVDLTSSGSSSMIVMFAMTALIGILGLGFFAMGMWVFLRKRRSSTAVGE